ncbi:hypothetical protein D9758_007684 [Tetrapyrgos nigripes]|uniref:Uncharacterized protein n=1 Tax=Tetrapyrgos nigripes TaxID=182062 RepID=A0A8H5G5I8_9AGAR|nr:hypothetical protein D9758_007684 [Tetrapyrgos nigripes]
MENRTLAVGETRATPTERPNDHANTFSNASSSSEEEEQAMAGPGQTISNLSNSSTSAPPDQHEENQKYSIFEGASEIDFVAENEIFQAGDGRYAVEGFNQAQDMTFDSGFQLTAVGELHQGRVGPDDVSSSGAGGAGMKHFGQAKRMTFKGTKMQFIARKVEERVPAE